MRASVFKERERALCSPRDGSNAGYSHAKRRYNQALDLSPGGRHGATLWRAVVRLLFGGCVMAPVPFTTFLRRHK